MASGDMLEPMGRIGGNIAVALRHISTLVGQAPQCA
jgi:hypothetical protein